MHRDREDKARGGRERPKTETGDRADIGDRRSSVVGVGTVKDLAYRTYR